ncbi:MAG: hypothetical protein AAB903_03925 [Patescibacteria group bacterium]
MKDLSGKTTAQLLTILIHTDDRATQNAIQQLIHWRENRNPLGYPQPKTRLIDGVRVFTYIQSDSQPTENWRGFACNLIDLIIGLLFSLRSRLLPR